MYSFIVLGLIPGTNIQITLTILMDSILTLFGLVCVGWLLRHRRAAKQLLQDFAPLVRRQLHASSLHQRGI